MFRNLKLQSLLVLSLLALGQVTSAWALDGAGGSNGGAGVRRGGKLMSFYSAGLYVEPQADSDVPYMPPELDHLLDFISKFKYWSTQDKAKLIQIAMPSPQHQYFKVKADQFTPETKNRLLAEFSRVTGQSVDGLELFAITDVERGQTFLLPSFYDLEKPSDKVAILFHENYWMVTRGSTDYQKVVNTELAFQAVYEQPNSGPRIMDLITKYGDQSALAQVAAKIDLESGALNGLIDEGMIPLDQIIGQDLLNCSNDCVPGMVALNLVRLVQKYPNSVVLRQLLARQQNGDYDRHKIKIKYSYSYTRGDTYTPFGWVPFPSIDHAVADLDIEETLDTPNRRKDLKLNLASCKLDLNPGKVGALHCSDTNSSVQDDTIMLIYQ